MQNRLQGCGKKFQVLLRAVLHQMTDQDSLLPGVPSFEPDGQSLHVVFHNEVSGALCFNGRMQAALQIVSEGIH